MPISNITPPTRTPSGGQFIGAAVAFVVIGAIGAGAFWPNEAATAVAIGTCLVGAAVCWVGAGIVEAIRWSAGQRRKDAA